MNTETLKSQSEMSEDRRILAEMMAALDEHQGSVPDGLYLTLCNHLRDLHRGRRVVTRVPERPRETQQPPVRSGGAHRWLTDEELEVDRVGWEWVRLRPLM